MSFLEILFRSVRAGLGRFLDVATVLIVLTVLLFLYKLFSVSGE